MLFCFLMLLFILKKSSFVFSYQFFFPCLPVLQQIIKDWENIPKYKKAPCSWLLTVAWYLSLGNCTSSFIKHPRDIIWTLILMNTEKMAYLSTTACFHLLVIIMTQGIRCKFSHISMQVGLGLVNMHCWVVFGKLCFQIFSCSK